MEHNIKRLERLRERLQHRKQQRVGGRGAGRLWRAGGQARVGRLRPPGASGRRVGTGGSKLNRDSRSLSRYMLVLAVLITCMRALRLPLWCRQEGAPHVGVHC